MTRIFGKNNHIEARLAHLVQTIQEENRNKSLHVGSYIECFKGSNLRRTLTSIFVICGNITAGGSFVAQSIYFLTVAGLAAIHTFDVSIGGFGLAVLCIIITNVFTPKVPRRTIFVFGGAINGIGMLVIGCLYFAPGTGPLWAISVLM
jgi:hypothetical protein